MSRVYIVCMTWAVSAYCNKHIPCRVPVYSTASMTTLMDVINVETLHPVG